MIVDNELVEKIKNNDNVVIARLYDYCRLDGMKLALGYDVDNAESLFHEAFLRAIEKIDLFDTSRDFLPWFKTILENICRRYVSRESKTIDLSFGENESEEEYSWVNDEYSHEATPEKIYIEKESEQAVRSIINELPEEQREAIFLFYYKGSSIAEIAKIQNANENTIKSRLNYSKQKIEKGVEEYQKKTGVKLYSFSPLLIVALRRSDLMKLFDSLNEKWDKALYGAAVAEVTKDTTVAATTTTTAVVATSVKAGIITKLLVGGLAAVAVTIAGIAIVSGVKDNKDDKKANEVVAKVEETEESEEVLVVESVSEDVVVEKSEYEIAEEIFVSYLEENVFEEYPLVDENGLIIMPYFADYYVNDGSGKITPEVNKRSEYSIYNTGVEAGTLNYYIDDFDTDSEYEMLVIKSVDGIKIYEIYELNEQGAYKKSELISPMDEYKDYLCSEVMTIEILDSKDIKECRGYYYEEGNYYSSGWRAYVYDGDVLIEEGSAYIDKDGEINYYAIDKDFEAETSEICEKLKKAETECVLVKYEKESYINDDYFDMLNIVDYGIEDTFNSEDYVHYKKEDYINTIRNYTSDTIFDLYIEDYDNDGDYELFFHTTDKYLGDQDYWWDVDGYLGKTLYLDGGEIKVVEERGEYYPCCDVQKFSDGTAIFINYIRDAHNSGHSNIYYVKDNDVNTVEMENVDMQVPIRDEEGNILSYTSYSIRYDQSRVSIGFYEEDMVRISTNWRDPPCDCYLEEDYDISATYRYEGGKLYFVDYVILDDWYDEEDY